MAQIIENKNGRRNIRLNCDDIISIVREYQNLTYLETNYNTIRQKLSKIEFYIPEDV